MSWRKFPLEQKKRFRDELLFLLGGDAYQQFQRKYFHDPAGFMRDCVIWPTGTGPFPYQTNVLDAIPEHHRVCVRSGRGAGKTATIAVGILWFSLTRDGLDWKVVATAAVGRQLQKYLWPEVHKWAARLRWDVIGRPPFSKDELLTEHIHLNTGQAFGVVSKNHAHVEGAHAENLLWIFDEAKTIEEAMWDAAEGAMNVGDCYALAFSTPELPVGRFFDIQSGRDGYRDWWTRRITLEEILETGKINEAWIRDRREQWGPKSQLYQNQVLGEFASGDEDGVIPLAWVEEAMGRWEDDPPEWGRCDYIGVDIARTGSDKTVFAFLRGRDIVEIREYTKSDTMETTGLIVRAYEETGGIPVVDAIGMGGPIVDRLSELRIPVISFVASEGTSYVDKTGKVKFANLRAAAWWFMRELLNPFNEEGVRLPPDYKLKGDFTKPRYKTQSGGRVLVEAKADIRKRLKRSSDYADAVIQAFAAEEIIGGLVEIGVVTF
jgi:hypothetical protein